MIAYVDGAAQAAKRLLEVVNINEDSCLAIIATGLEVGPGAAHLCLKCVFDDS